MVFLTFISKAFKQQWNFLFKDAVFWQQKVCLPGACCPWSLSIPAGCWSPFSGSPAACEAAAPPRSYSPAPLWTVPAAPPGCRSEATWQVDQRGDNDTSQCLGSKMSLGSVRPKLNTKLPLFLSSPELLSPSVAGLPARTVCSQWWMHAASFVQPATNTETGTHEKIRCAVIYKQQRRCEGTGIDFEKISAHAAPRILQLEFFWHSELTACTNGVVHPPQPSELNTGGQSWQLKANGA